MLITRSMPAQSQGYPIFAHLRFGSTARVVWSCSCVLQFFLPLKLLVTGNSSWNVMKNCFGWLLICRIAIYWCLFCFLMNVLQVLSPRILPPDYRKGCSNYSKFSV